MNQSLLPAHFQPSPHEVAVHVWQAFFCHPIDPALDRFDLDNLVLDVGRHVADQWARILSKPPYQTHVLLVETPGVARTEQLQGPGACEFVR